MPIARFQVPVGEASGIGSGLWFWRIASWKGVRNADLEGLFGTLTVEGTKRAIARVARFCAGRGYARLSEEP